MEFKSGDKVKLTFWGKIRYFLLSPENYRVLNYTFPVDWVGRYMVFTLLELENGKTEEHVFYKNQVYLVRTKKKKLTYKDFLRDKNET